MAGSPTHLHFIFFLLRHPLCYVLEEADCLCILYTIPVFKSILDQSLYLLDLPDSHNTVSPLRITKSGQFCTFSVWFEGGHIANWLQSSDCVSKQCHGSNLAPRRSLTILNENDHYVFSLY